MTGCRTRRPTPGGRGTGEDRGACTAQHPCPIGGTFWTMRRSKADRWATDCFHPTDPRDHGAWFDTTADGHPPVDARTHADECLGWGRSGAPAGCSDTPLEATVCPGRLERRIHRPVRIGALRTPFFVQARLCRDARDLHGKRPAIFAILRCNGCCVPAYNHPSVLPAGSTSHTVDLLVLGKTMDQKAFNLEQEAKNKLLEAERLEGPGQFEYDSENRARTLREESIHARNDAHQLRLDADHDWQVRMNKLQSDATKRSMDAQRAEDDRLAARAGELFRIERDTVRRVQEELYKQCAEAPDSSLDQLIEADQPRFLASELDAVRRQMTIDSLSALRESYLKRVVVWGVRFAQDGKSMVPFVDSSQPPSNLGNPTQMAGLANAVIANKVGAEFYTTYPFPPMPALRLSELWAGATGKRLEWRSEIQNRVATGEYPVLTSKRQAWFEAKLQSSLNDLHSIKVSDAVIRSHEIVVTYIGSAVLALPNDEIVAHYRDVLSRRVEGLVGDALHLPDDALPPVLDLDGSQHFVARKPLVFGAVISRALREKAKKLPPIVFGALTDGKSTGMADGKAKPSLLARLFSPGASVGSDRKPSPSVIVTRNERLTKARFEALRTVYWSFWDENDAREKAGQDWLSSHVLDERLHEASQQHAQIREEARRRGELG